METTSPSLLERLRQPGAAEAWDKFVGLYTPFLFSWARRAGLQESDAADLVQDVLTLLVRKLPEFRYDRQQSFRGWLRTVTLNKYRERRRRPSARQVQAGSEVNDVPAPEAMAAFEETEYRQALVQRALAGLQSEFPPLTWKAFSEYVVAGRNAAEVARDLEIPIGTVYAAKSRVLSRLRSELDGLLD